MTDSARLAFQFEARTNLGRGAVGGQSQAISNVAGGTWSQYFPLVPRAGSKNVLGVFVQSQVAMTSSGVQAATATQMVGPTTTPTDLLDEWVYEVQIAPAPNTQARTYLTTRLAIEELERVSLNVRGYSYPRAVPANFGGAGSRTDTSYAFFPVGGGGGAIRFHVPAITNVYAASITASTVTITVYVISGDNDTVIAAIEKQTPSLGTGRNDGSPYYPAELAPDFVFFLNETTTSLTTLYVTATDGTILADLQDAGVIGQVQSATVSPDTTFTYNDLIFAMDQKRFLTFLFNLGTTGVRDLVFVQFAGSASSNAPATPAQTPTTPAVSQVGVPVGAGSAVAPVGGVGIPSPGATGAAYSGGIMGGVTVATRKRR